MRVLYFIIITILITTISCRENRKGNTQNIESIECCDTTGYSLSPEFYDFGDINCGEIVGYTFTLKNTGNHPLVIKDVKSGCACTTVELEKESIKPNETCKIDIQFNSAGRNGFQMKEISIFANVKKGVIKLPFTCNVK